MNYSLVSFFNMRKNLSEAEDIGEFKRIFIDCIECHYHAYSTCRVLHRHISENNLMIWHLDSEVRQ
ncbi:hypothetical protein CPB84DRAFT_1780377 [Gymnopilus junonius]|uniref:Fungal-type protein kinase domain-containing protein n=1 Tax=Gymnopilus junonius TaxID=109634 RepID=A0A9P5NM94_GYMJU|nr:hypothetical protein CPB84DRAFT_1780377 [Gymnopilus junonius]